MHGNGVNVTFFVSFEDKYIPKENIKIIDNKNITTNMNRTEASESIMCGYFWILFIDYMVKGKSLLDHTNLLYPNK